MSDGLPDGLIEKIFEFDASYPPGAYGFVQRVVNCAVKKEHGHVKGEDLVILAKAMVQEQFGVFAREVLHSWNIEKPLDIGRIVYNLIEVGALQQGEGDRIDDFMMAEDFFDSLQGMDEEDDLKIEVPLIE